MASEAMKSKYNNDNQSITTVFNRKEKNDDDDSFEILQLISIFCRYSLSIENPADFSAPKTNNYSPAITSINDHESLTPIDSIRNMTCSSPMRHQNTNLTVLDVYDEAALIGKDFERIIDAYGTETIRDLVPKVIRILELLELQAAKNERDADEYLEMKTRIVRLETEKNETRELREKFDRELDLTEEQWRKEADNLMILVSKLQDDNRRLRDELERNSDLHNKSDLTNSIETISITREELLCIKNLTEENIKLKRILKGKDKELTQKTLDIEAVQAQLDRMCKANCTLRQKNTFSTNQSQRLMVEKLDLEVKLKEKENYINQMKDRVADELSSPISSINPIDSIEDFETTQPKFTLEELRQVLWERNDLKTKLMEVEEELRMFKDHEDDDDYDVNAPVQGPIPLEPEEKLNGYKRDESKIRQFVRSFFPLSKKASPLEPTTPISAAIPIVSTPPSTSVASSDSLSKRLSVESFFGTSKKTPKANIPVLTPPPSQ
ncbi:unnamed protein product [Rotaria magnacalcarata]|uniref:RILP-like protein homolog n=3 Tax=Rotaria magnacalcarata TaxID=392030 RepID=A0A816CBK5_9BILA|nr:unnamed protein product [Rotaria magnacalcarata]CAF2029613.1 unnamed protein product [Rotaria magnacalcarata]